MDTGKEINKNGCIMCGENLIYTKEYSDVKCIYCSKVFESNVICKEGHYVCNSCHSLKGTDLILTYCSSTNKKNPIEMANDIMKSDGVFMHGPEHHYAVPAILITSYYKNTGEVERLEESLLLARKRAEDVKGGFCGFYGSCGAAVGCGIFLSIITSTTPLTKDTWGVVNEVTGRVLIALSKIGGPRCCKKGVFTAIHETSKLLHERFNVKLYDYENSVPSCSFSSLNKECIGKNCPYNSGNF